MSLAYFPFYPDDFEADTAHLTMLEDGAYNRLLRICWRSPGCRVPADEVWLFRKLRARTEDEMAAIRAVVEEYFEAKGGMLTNPKLLKIWGESNEAYEKRANAGSKGGKSKALKTNETGPSNATAMLKQPEPEPIYTEANASDGDAVDFAKAIFDQGVKFLCRHGSKESSARSVIGRWRKEHHDREIFDAFAAAKREGAVDPVSWITARLGAPPKAFVPQFDLSKFGTTQ